jgi:C4-dicarboxylate-binding protein DctP
MFEMTKQGSLDMVSCNATIIGTWVPETMAVIIPYLFKDLNVFFKMMNSPRADELNNIIKKKTGVRVLAWYSAGPYYNFMTVKKKIRIPSDLKGLKIRVQESPYMIQLVKLTGASPTPISWSELYTSLQQGVIDGLVTGVPWLTDIGAHEVIKHINVANPILGPSIFGIQEKVFQSFSKYEQDLIVGAAQQAIVMQAGLTNWGHDLWVSFMQKHGIEVHFPTQQEQEQWVKTLKGPMADWTGEQIGKEWVNAFIKLSKEVENEIY